MIIPMIPNPGSVMSRWFPLKPHPRQIALVNDEKRFKVVPAGRRSGKTERAKRFIVREMLRKPGKYFVAAPTRAHVKQIYWDDLKALCMFFTFIDKDSVRESELKISVPFTGSSITLVGLDVPQRFEGVAWSGGVVDEIADIKPEAWGTNISPALDTLHPDGHKAWCWLIGVPDGFNHFYNLAEYAKNSNDKEWGLYHWTSAEILSPEDISAARGRLSARQFRQEYEASFETSGGRIYKDYGDSNHTGRVLRSHDKIHWCHDFNFSPLSSAICVRESDTVFVVGEIILTSAIAKQAAVEFVTKYKDHENKSMFLYGDPAGRVGEKHGHKSDYVVIENTLRECGWEVSRKVKLAAPAIRDRQNALRSKILSAEGTRTFFVNPRTAPWCNDAMVKVQIKIGSSFQEQETDHQHVTTAIGYMVDYEWPINFIKKDVSNQVAPMTVNYYG